MFHLNKTGDVLENKKYSLASRRCLIASVSRDVEGYFFQTQMLT